MARLHDILEVSHARAQSLTPRRAELERAALAAPPGPPFAAALGGSAVAVIAEVKRRSPSAGAIAPTLDPAVLAGRYVAGGAAAVSVLTDGPHFGGSLDDLAAVRAAVDRPVLRKDFLVDPVQVFESRAAGASAVLLIARILKDAELRLLARLAGDLGMDRLVEVHSLQELERAVAVEPEMIGVNSRDLDSFRVSLDACAPLLAAVPTTCTAVAESGIATQEDVRQVAVHGADAVLVGTAVAAAADPTAAVAGLRGVPRRTRTGPTAARGTA